MLALDSHVRSWAARVSRTCPRPKVTRSPQYPPTLLPAVRRVRQPPAQPHSHAPLCSVLFRVYCALHLPTPSTPRLAYRLFVH